MTVDEKAQKELVREQFTKTAAIFGNFAVATRGTEAEKLAQMVGVAKNDRVIDVACGPGTLALRFAHHAGRVCGVDLTPAILKRAKNSAAADGLTNLDVTVADGGHLPFADGSIDIALTSYALHHMDAARVLGEMARVVRPGGRVGVIDIRVQEDDATDELNNRIERTRDASHTRTLRISQFEVIFRRNGLRVIGKQIQQDARAFDHWLLVAGWKPGDAAYDETRRLMESTLQNDLAGFHPRFETSKNTGKNELMITNTVLLIAGEKI